MGPENKPDQNSQPTTPPPVTPPTEPTTPPAAPAETSQTPEAPDFSTPSSNLGSAPTPQPTVGQGKKSPMLMWLLIVLVLAVVGFLAYWFLMR